MLTDYTTYRCLDDGQTFATDGDAEAHVVANAGHAVVICAQG